MAYPYPSSINGTKGFSGILNYVNTVTDSWISNIALIAIYVIILIGFYKAKDDFTGALAVAGYGTFVVGLFFWIGGFISGFALGVAIALAIIGTVILLLDQQ